MAAVPVGLLAVFGHVFPPGPVSLAAKPPPARAHVLILRPGGVPCAGNARPPPAAP